jgi:predicted nucleic acid-binding protein
MRFTAFSASYELRALAMHLNAVFLTADEKYYRKVEMMGCIQLLSDWQWDVTRSDAFS